MNQAELLRYLVEAFETLGIDYMISGSQASIYYGEPRFTQDIDVVADVTPAHVLALREHSLDDRREVIGKRAWP